MVELEDLIKERKGPLTKVAEPRQRRD